MLLLPQKLYGREKSLNNEALFITIQYIVAGLTLTAAALSTHALIFYVIIKKLLQKAKRKSFHFSSIQ